MSDSRTLYECRLYLETNYADYKKNITLPFVPFVGLRIADLDDAREPHIVEEVVWLVDENKFNVWCEPALWVEDDIAASELTQRGWVR